MITSTIINQYELGNKTEPTYFDVAETIYHEHDHLIVGKVDCTRYSSVCKSFNVQAYPTILFLNKQSQVIYNGKLSHDSMVDFSRRLAGPDINHIDSCQHLNKLTDQHEFVLVSNLRNLSDPIQAEFQHLSKLLKPNFWFYQLTKPCKSPLAPDGEIFILKRHLKLPIRFNQSISQTLNLAERDDNELRSNIIGWLNWNSFPVFGQIDRHNTDHILSYSNLLVMVVLDHYEPAKQFMPTSVQLHETFGNLSKELAQHESPPLSSVMSDSFTTFAWTSDMSFIASVIINDFVVPNLIILKPNYSYYLHLRERPKQLSKEDQASDKLDPRLAKASLRFVISQAKAGELQFEAGSHLMTTIRRKIFTTTEGFKSMYKTNALLTLLLFGLPTSIVLFVVYTTCFSERSPSAVARDEEEQEALLRNNQRAATRNTNANRSHQHQD